jgi:quercetin dioxygenase-like cupin family protein
MIKPIEITPATVASFQLDEVAEQLESEKAYASSRKTAATLARDDNLTVLLTTIQKGETVREHHAPGPGLVIVLAGRVSFNGGEAPIELGERSALAFAAGLPHSIEAHEDSRFLVVIGGQVEMGEAR